jgi:gliding motility-associatede transport system auxiliary component
VDQDQARGPDICATGVLAAGGIAAVGVALFLLFRPTPVQLTQAPEVERARLERQRHGIGLLVAAAGVVLLVIAGWLGFTQGLRSLGESFGLAVFGLVAVVGGFMQVSGGGTSQETFFQALTAKKANVSGALIFVGMGLLVLGVYLRLKPFADAPANWFPLWVGAGLLGLVLSGGGAYLRVSTTVTPTAMRLFILTVGGLSGLIIAFFTFCMAWIWRNDVFFAGVPGWNGDNGWRLWLCAYVELIGLALLFGSLLLARADVRTYPTLRRVLYGYNAVLTGLLVLIFLVALNIVVIAAYPLSLHWTEVQGFYGLSEKSEDLLMKLKEPTTVYLIMSERFPTYGDMRRFLKNCQSYTDKLKVELIDPESPADKNQYIELLQKYKEVQPPLERNPMSRGGSEGRGVLLVYGPEDTKKEPKRVMIGADKLQDTNEQPGRNPDEKPKKTFRFLGEVAVMSELQHFMMDEKKTKVYFLQGNGELDISNSFQFIDVQRRRLTVEFAPFGGGVFVDRLEKENLEVKGLSFSSSPKQDPRTVYITGEQRKEVPKDCQVLVIAGPSRKMPKETLNAIERYLDSGSDKRLLVLFDIVAANADFTAMVETGLEPLLNDKLSVEVGKDYAFRYSPELGNRDPLDAKFVLARMSADADNPVAKKFTREFEFESARVIRAAAKGGRGQAATVLEAISEPDTFVVWAEPDLKLLKDRMSQINHGRDYWRSHPDLHDYRNKVPIGVTVSQDGKPRAVVLGNAGMASNSQMSQANNSFNMLASFIDWLTDRPGLGVRPREQGVFTISPKIKQEWGRITLMPGWLMTLGVLGLGLAAWVVRRK